MYIYHIAPHVGCLLKIYLLIIAKNFFYAAIDQERNAMEVMPTFVQSILKHYSLFHWTDALEIFFFTTIFYHFSLWLRKDRQKNLLFSFYAYCALAFLSYAFKLDTMTYFLFLYAPVALMLFILLHQDILQKNFIVARSFKPVQPKQQEWLAVLMQSLLVAVNRNKQVICVIEKNDSLKTLLTSPLTFNTEANTDLLDILLNSPSFDATKMVLLNHQGNLLAINATWQSLVDETWTSDIQDMETWKQDAFLLTNKTDALVFSILPSSRTCTIIAQKKFLEGISINEAVITIKHYLYGSTTPLPTYKGYHESSTKRAGNQPLS